MIAKVEDGEIVLSKGLIWVLSITMAIAGILLVPWAFRVEANASRLSDTLARIDERSKSWAQIAQSLTDHLVNPDVHYAKLAELEQKLAAMQQHLDELHEDMVDN